MNKRLLKKIRLACSLSQEELARALGVSTKTIYRWESGESSPSRQSIKDLAKYLYPRSKSIMPISVYSKFCTLRRDAIVEVGRAIRAGELIRLTTNIIKCADCDERATQYDHRDYTKPLFVDPVCQSCNFKRGFAVETLPHIWKV